MRRQHITALPEPGDSGVTPLRAPPINPPTWEWYIPVYFWLGGIAAGGWLAATAEATTGERDPSVMRAGRYLALAGAAAGSGLLIADLGLSRRFLNMLRLVRPRSMMSLGSWQLAAFGGMTGVGAAVQAAQDGIFGSGLRSASIRWWWLDRLVQLVGLPGALFIGSYTGVLLGSTSVPSLARRSLWLGPLFLSSAASSGLAAVALCVEANEKATPRLRRRLARAEAGAVLAELVLERASRLAIRDLPSTQTEPRAMRSVRAAMRVGGALVPLAMEIGVDLLLARRRQDAGSGSVSTGRSTSPRPDHADDGAARRSERALTAARLAAPTLTLLGSLALRFLTTHEGVRSALTSGDTWTFAKRRRRPSALLAGQLASEPA